MSAVNETFLKINSITSIGVDDLNSDSATPRMQPGAIAILVDSFGPRITQYVKAVDAAAYANLLSRPANVSVANITSGSTVSAVTTGLTASEHDGKLCYVLDDAGGAGAAPEGEVGIIGSNSTTTIKLDPNRPLSAALAVNDDLVLIANWQGEDAADGDLAHTVIGVCMGTSGISDNGYGWVQRLGVTPAAIAAGALVAGDPVVAAAGVLGAFGTDGQELWCGIALAAASADMVNLQAPVQLTVFSAAGPGGSP